VELLALIPESLKKNHPKQSLALERVLETAQADASRVQVLK
jgi:hypothetical protein